MINLGVYRKSGHEHLNGCIVVPVVELTGGVRQLYGRRIDPKAPKDKRHLYLARPLAGVFNPAALGNREIILAESIIDALTFYRSGMEAVTCTFGTANFTPELFGAIKAAKIDSVRLAFDADKAGDEAAEAAAKRLGPSASSATESASRSARTPTATPSTKARKRCAKPSRQEMASLCLPLAFPCASRSSERAGGGQGGCTPRRARR